MDEANYLGEDFKLYGVNLKVSFHQSPPSIYNSCNGFSLVKRPFIDNSNITDS
jgi:hypothetical protein